MSGTVQIPGYNVSNRVPGAYAVVDASKANTASQLQVTLIIGQMTGVGTATPGTAVISAGVGDAQTSFGAGSMLAIEVERYRALDTTGTVWCLPLADAGTVLVTTAAQGTPGTTLQFAAGTLGDVIAGETVSGTGVAASTTVAGVNDATGVVTLSATTTSAVTIGASITFGSSAAATMSITFTGTATATAVLPLYVDGHYVPVSVSSAQTAAQVATSVAAAANAWTSPGGNPLSWVASASSATVTFTARNAGAIGNQGTIVLSYGGTVAGQGQPGGTNVPGITATITAATGGTTNPVLATALANLPQQSFDFIVCPYNDSTTLAALTSFLSDGTGRWNWSSELFGGAFTAYGGTLSARTTWSTALNDQHLTAIGANGSPSPDYHWAVDYAAAAAVSLRANPAVPVGGFQQGGEGGGVALNVLAPQLANRDTYSEMNTLLFDGMSTYGVDASGVVRVGRAITTYQKNQAGSPDNSYLDLNVPYQLAAYIRAWRTMITSQFNQKVLVANGTRIPPGSSMVTPATVQFATVAQYRQLALDGGYGLPAGIVANPDAFASGISVTNAGSGLLTCLLPVQLSTGLIVVAADVQFTRT